MTKHSHSFNSSWAFLVRAITLITIGGFLASMYHTNALPFYIRPDYFRLTITAGYILIFAGVINCAIFCHGLITKKLTSENLELVAALSQGVILGSLLIPAVFLPHRSLSALAASRRANNQTVLTSPPSKTNFAYRQQSPLFLVAQTHTFNLVDWARAFSLNPEPEVYRGKAVQVEGIVQPNPDRTFSVVRFVISCCAVDATPVGFTVDQQLKNLRADDWVRVEGTFGVKEVNGQRKLIIIPTVVQIIPTPRNPYLY